MAGFTEKSPQLKTRGPIVDVYISVSSAYKMMLEEAGKPIPPGATKRFMVDTGATSTVLKIGTAQELGLPVRGQRIIQAPETDDEGEERYTHDVDITLQKGLRFPNILASEMPLKGQDIDGLIGRDILSRCLLVYNGQEGSFTLVDLE